MSIDSSEDTSNIEKKFHIKNIDIDYTKYSKFEDFNLHNDVLWDIYNYGWERPSHIQKLAIPAISTGRNVLIQAQSGMGKTGAFTLGLLNCIDLKSPTVQGIIILNTRDLAMQVHKIVCALCEKSRINVLLLIGGQNQNAESSGRRQSRMQRVNDPTMPTIIVGCPGKISDVFNRRQIDQTISVKTIIIDEFDKTLERTFIDDIMYIFDYVRRAQLIIVSATTDLHIVDDIMNYLGEDHIEITLDPEDVMLAGISHYIIDCPKEGKYDTIVDLMTNLVAAQTIIFINSKNDCDSIYSAMNTDGYGVKHIHGGMSQEERNKIMADFRNGSIRVLLSTGLLSRGIDVNTVSLVILYDLPTDYNEYIHRIGRTGRYGKKGVAISLIDSSSKHETASLANIERAFNMTIPEFTKEAYATLSGEQ